MSRNNNDATGNLDFLYDQKYYKLFGIDLSRQSNTTLPQQINSGRTLNRDDAATMYFIAEKQHKTILNFSFVSLIGTE